MKKYFIVVPLLLFLSAACAPYSVKHQKLVDQVARGDYDLAARTLDKLEHRHPTLLDLMDRGTLFHLQQKYQESNAIFDQAERMIDDLFAVSVSREAATYLVNDLTQVYSGEDFERIWVNMMMAFNYIELGNLEEAMVEARKIDHKLKVYADQYAGKSNFKNHAFAHYLSGLLHEAGDEWNDARVSYWKALQGYADYERFYGVSTPVALREDLLCASKKLGITTEVEDFQKKFNLTGCPQARGNREVVFLIALGKVAHKEERYWGIEAPGGPLLKVAYPAFVNTAYANRRAEVIYQGKTYRSFMTENISRIARKTLSDRMAFVASRAAARALLKAGASAAAGVAVAQSSKNEELGALAAILTNILLGYTERADTRSWLTLPAQIQMIRVPVDSASIGQTFQILYRDAHGQAQYTENLQVKWRESSKAFVIVRAKEP